VERQVRRATLIVNRSARGVRPGFDPGRAARYLERRGVTVTLVVPGSAEAVTAAAASAARAGDDAAFVLGGDGTLRDAAAGLAGSNTALAALPGGTVNIWAREMGLPATVRGAIDAHLGGQRVRADIGLAGNRPFLLMASIGWDAAASRAVSPALKRWFGDKAYYASFARLLPGLRLEPVRWRAGIATDDHRMVMVVVSNTRLYGGRVNFSPGATANDGLLDVAALCPPGVTGVLRMMGEVAINRIARDPAVVSFQTSDLLIETPGLPVQLDGDYACETPLRFGVDPLALAVSVPAGPLPPVLGG
jgi:diacylglycerol kinase family enzyme